MKAITVAFWESLRYFSRDEFEAPDEMSMELLSLLDHARGIAGVPFVINSSFREGDEGSHGKGVAVDISCRHSWVRFRIVSALLEVGCSRIGIYRHHVHVDIAPDRVSEVMWYGRYTDPNMEATYAQRSEDESSELEASVPERSSQAASEKSDARV